VYVRNDVAEIAPRMSVGLGPGGLTFATEF
jgi:hypothetical protein